MAYGVGRTPVAVDLEPIGVLLLQKLRDSLKHVGDLAIGYAFAVRRSRVVNRRSLACETEPG